MSDNSITSNETLISLLQEIRHLLKNPIPRPITSSFNFYVDSSNRLSKSVSSSDFYFNVLIPPNNNFTRAVLMGAVIPKTFYPIESPYNTLVLSEPGYVPVTITIPPNGYDFYNLVTELTSLLNELSPHNVAAGTVVWDYNVSYPSRLDAKSGLFTFTVSGNGSNQPSINFDYPSAFEQLGFDPNSTNPFVSNTLVSTNIAYLQSERSLFLHTNLIQNKFDNILQSIYCGFVPFGSSIVFSQLEYILNSKPINDTNNNEFYFRLTDESGRDINLHGNTVNYNIILF